MRSMCYIVASKVVAVGGGRTLVLAAGRPLLHAAQRADEVRRDLTLEQITDMLVAIAGMHGDTAYL